MPFNPSGLAELKAINLRKGTSDDSNEVLDAKFSMTDISCAVAASLLGATEDEVRSAFFRSIAEDADQNPRFFGVKGVESNAKWEGKHAIKVKGLRTLHCNSVGKVHFVPRGHATFDMTFSVALEQPPAGYLESLWSRLNNTVEISLEHDAELFDKPDLETASVREAVKASIGKRQADAFDRTPKVAKPKAFRKPGKKAPTKKAAKHPAKKAAKKPSKRATVRNDDNYALGA